MANVALALTIPAAFLSGRGIRFDNQDGEIAVVLKDAATTVTVNALRLKRVYKAVVFDSDGAQVTGAVIGGLGTNVLALSVLGSGTKDLIVLMSGTKL
jgi:hypothetical protein